jgi:hypothetical protein
MWGSPDEVVLTSGFSIKEVTSLQKENKKEKKKRDLFKTN